MPLQLVLGPANCGKIALLLDRFLEAADADLDPFLIVPNRLDVEALERELVSRRGVLAGGRIGTFDDLFEEVLGRCRELRPLVGEVQRRAAAHGRGGGNAARGARGVGPVRGLRGRRRRARR